MGFAHHAMTWQASQQIEGGDFAAAERAYRAILENFPGDPVAKFMLMECEKIRIADLPDTPREPVRQPTCGPNRGSKGFRRDE